MRNSILASVAALGILAVIARAALPVSAQDNGIPPLVITAFNGGTAPSYAVPRTPWGDPDLAGQLDQRRREFSSVASAEPGRTLSRRRSLGAAAEADPDDGSRTATTKAGAFRNDVARRAFRQTSAIVDPADGRMPAFTPEAEKRRAPRDFGTFGDGPFDWTTDFTLYDRCITRGIVYSGVRSPYGNGVRIFQAPGIGRDLLRDGSRHARHLYGRPSASPQGPQAVSRRLARALGGRRARRRDHEPDGSRPASTHRTVAVSATATR